MARWSPQARRWFGIAASAVAALGAVHLFAATASEADPSTAAASAGATERRNAARTSADARSAAPAAELNLALIERARPARGEAQGGSARLFAPHSWQPPPPKAPPPPPPEPARAPAFPLVYFGGLQDERGRLGFFLRGADVVAARAGDRLGEFQLDTLDAERAVVTYLPLGQSQTIGASAPSQRP